MCKRGNHGPLEPIAWQETMQGTVSESVGSDSAIMFPSVSPAQRHGATRKESRFPLHAEMSSCLQIIADYYDFTQVFYYILNRNMME